MTSQMSLPAGYTIRSGYPPATAYNALRKMGNLTPVSPVQAEMAVRGDGQGAWEGVMIIYTPSTTALTASISPVPTSEEVFRVPGDAEEFIVGMGRRHTVLGDGSWYFHFADIVVHPAHQRKGLGDAIMKHLLQRIKDRAPEAGKNAYITLLADPPGVKLYSRNGFKDLLSGTGERGMGFRLGA